MKRFTTAAAIVGILFTGFVLAQEKPAAPAPPAKAKPAPQAPLAKMKEALQVTPDQEAKLKAFREARRNENEAFAEQMRKSRGDLQSLRRDPKADPAKVNGLIDQIYKLQADRAKAGFRNGQDWQKIFTPDQLEKMKQGRNRLMGMGLRRGRDMGPGVRRGMMLRRGMGSAPRAPMMGPGMRRGFDQRFQTQRMGMQQRFGQRGPGAMGARHRQGLRRSWMNRLPGLGWKWGRLWNEK